MSQEQSYGERVRQFRENQQGERPNYEAVGNLGKNFQLNCNLNEHDDQPTLEEFDVSEENLISAALEAKQRGNDFYRAGDFSNALEEYTSGINVLDNSDVVSSVEMKENAAVLYCNAAACYIALEDYKEVERCCTKAIELKAKYEKAYLRRVKAFEKLEKYAEAVEDLKTLVQLEGDSKMRRQYQTQLAEMEKLNKAYLEKQKEEVMGKLKDLGNTLLGKFGMSLNDFQTVQDPNTGSYSIQMKKK